MCFLKYYKIKKISINLNFIIETLNQNWHNVENFDYTHDPKWASYSLSIISYPH